ncbi:MAG: type II secretion system F family protein [Myxococcota bacterium]
MRFGEFFARRRRVQGRALMFFTERLALLLEAGIPLHSGLETLERQATATHVQQMIRDLRLGVSGGLSLSQALAKQPEIFGTTYTNLVAAGEQGGFLPEVLQRLQEMDEKRQELSSTLMSALSYPAFLVVFSLAVVTFVLLVVFPKFAELFDSIRDELPLSTRVLMGTSEALGSYWPFVLGGLGATMLILWRGLKRPEGAALLDHCMLRLPVIRDIVIQLNVVQFMRVMSLSLGNGVGLIDALRASREVATSPAFRGFIDRLETRVSEGGRIAAGLDHKLLPPLVLEMVSTGEESGKLSLVMGRIADFYEREWRRKLAILSKIAEPAMLLVMGAVVGLLVSSLILPIFKLSRAVG